MQMQAIKGQLGALGHVYQDVSAFIGIGVTIVRDN